MPFFHYHDSFEIYYLLSGERYYFIKDRTYRIQQGDLVFIPNNVLHKTSVCGDPRHERIVINFKPTFLPSAASAETAQLLRLFAEDAAILRLLPTDQAQVEDWLRRMCKENDEQPFSSSLLVQSLLTQLLVFAARMLLEKQHDAREYTMPKHKRIYEVLDYINAQFHTSLRLDALAEHFFISPFHLSRTFKEVTGFTFVEYLNSVRVKEAQKLLRETDLQIIRIAERTGFENLSHFGRVFKQVAGVSPRTYRKARQSSPL